MKTFFKLILLCFMFQGALRAEDQKCPSGYHRVLAFDNLNDYFFDELAKYVPAAKRQYSSVCLNPASNVGYVVLCDHKMPAKVVPYAIKALGISWLGTANGLNVYVKNADIHDACGWSPPE